MNQQNMRDVNKNFEKRHLTGNIRNVVIHILQ